MRTGGVRATQSRKAGAASIARIAYVDGGGGRRLTALVSDRVEGPAIRHAVLAAVCVAAIALVYLVVWSVWPTLTVGAGGNDVLFLADGARRIAAGETPHVDFWLPTGAEPYLAYFAAERLLPQAPAYIGAHLIGFALLAPLAVAAGATFRRETELAAFLAVVALAALFPFNTTLPNFYGVSFHASYNRLGSAFAVAYLAWVFREAPGGVWRKGFLIAYALVFAFFLKIVFVGVALAPVVVLALVRKDWRHALAIALAAFGLTLGVVELATGMVGAYAGDIRAMAAVNSGSAPYFLASFIFRTFALQLLVAALLAWTLADAVAEIRRSGARLLSFRSFDTLGPPLAMAASVAALVFAESQATHGVEFTGVAGLLFALTVDGKRERPARTVLMVAALMVSAGTLAITAFENGVGSLLGRKGPARPVAWVERYLPHTQVPASMLNKAKATAALWTASSDTLRELTAAGLEPLNRSDPELYLAQWKTVDAALAEIRAPVETLGPVATLSNVDLFGLALRAQPTEGVQIVHDIGRTIVRPNLEQARAYLSRAQTVFAPTCALDEAPGPELMSTWFAQALSEDFTPRTLTPCWTMHSRKP